MQVATGRETTNILKRVLKKEFGIKARIISSKFAGGNSIDIEYDGGVSSETVMELLGRMQKGSYDPWEDLYRMENTGPVVFEGKVLPKFTFVDVTQVVPEDFFFRLACAYSEQVGMAYVHRCETLEDYVESFEKHVAGQWDWRDLIQYLWKKRNLVTDQFDQIEILEAFHLDGWEMGFTYAYNGKAYSTIDPIVANEGEKK